MSLATVIQDIERIEGLSHETKDLALMEVIDYHRALIIYHGDMREKLGVDYHFEPAMEKVIAGETTFMKEYQKLGPANFLLYGNMNITGGNFEMEPQIEIVDKTIERLYAKRRPCPRMITKAEAKKLKGKNPLRDIHLDLKALSGQHRLGKK